METWKFGDVFPIIFGYYQSGETEDPEEDNKPGQGEDPDQNDDPNDGKDPGNDNPGDNEDPGDNDNPGQETPGEDEIPNYKDMKIRLGNDISLKLRLALRDTTDYANIQSLHAIFVNRTLKSDIEREYKKKNRFIGRFPVEPFVDEFEPDEYNIYCSGYPKYRAFIANRYRGFGLHPNWKECLPVKDMPYAEYHSDVVRTIDRRTVSVLFPAKAQLHEGVYDLIIIAKVYDPGFKCNVRTVTADYKNIFELVSDSESATDSPVEIEINNEADDEPVEDIYVVSGSYGEDNIKLKRNDSRVVNIDISPITSWYEGE